MSSLPPDRNIHPDTAEQATIRLRHPHILRDDSIRSATTLAQWKSGSLLINEEGRIKLFPYLADIAAIRKAKFDAEKALEDENDETIRKIPDHDLIKYKLGESLYAQGLYDPAPSSHRLFGLIDFLYFPDDVKAKCDFNDNAVGIAADNRSSFQDLIDLWELMALTVDETLYRHSATAYALYAPLWGDIHLRFDIGFRLIKIATYFGDFELSNKIIIFLERRQLPLLSDQFDVEHYRFNLCRLKLNSAVNSSSTREYRDCMEGYEALYKRACKRNNELYELSKKKAYEHVATRHMELLRSICRGACRHSVRYVMRMLSSNRRIPPEVLDPCHRLTIEYFNPSEHSTRLCHSVPDWSNHDYDTLARTFAVVRVERLRARARKTRKVGSELLPLDQIRDALDDAKDKQQRARTETEKRIKRDHGLLCRTLHQRQLTEWVNGVTQERVYVGTVYKFWEGLTQAMLDVQLGRYEPLGEGRKAHFLDARKELKQLAEGKHFPTLRHSGYLLASTRSLVDTGLFIVDQAARNADSYKGKGS